MVDCNEIKSNVDEIIAFGVVVLIFDVEWIDVVLVFTSFDVEFVDDTVGFEETEVVGIDVVCEVCSFVVFIPVLEIDLMYPKNNHHQ
jgi:hypothetical protein